MMKLWLAVLVVVPLLSSAQVSVNWGDVDATRRAAASVLVAADPEWLKGGALYETAVKGVRALAEAGSDYIRLLNFNIFPGMSCAKLTEDGPWDFEAMDAVTKSFMDAAGNASVIVDIETSPAWMWADASAKQTHSCADDTATNLPVGLHTRCPYYGNTSLPRDKTWQEQATYYRRVAEWYTKGGFSNDDGKFLTSGHHYDFAYWEVLNEINIAREHNFSPAEYTSFYDTLVGQMRGASVRSGKFLGPSLAGASSRVSEEWFGYFLNSTNHQPPSTPVDAISFHVYGVCENHSAAGMEAIFPDTDTKLAGIRTIQRLKERLRPEVELHLTESGIVCNQPRGCGANDYNCWYRSFEPLFWIASAGQWAYQYLISTREADLTSIAHSQILGYPYKFDGTSGEWPSGTMVDWTTNELNAKFWVTLLMLQQVARPFSYCKTAGAPAGVHAQGIHSSKGRVLVLINKKNTNVHVDVPSAAGGAASVIDELSGNGPARIVTLTSDRITLKPFAVAFVRESDPFTALMV